MHYNHQSDYYVSRETAEAWWKAMPVEKFSVIDARTFADSAKHSEASNGVWVVVNPRQTVLAGVMTQLLKDGRWGLSVLWYDRERSSRLAKFFRARTLSWSKEAAAAIEEIVQRQGGKAS